eukprot:TRINITY_DN3694_c0_g1_i10.p1 TRINITY_DN3694_c0_g1~~TRINITY_DN3694_c0_g1_i10.p1  ORF type:complete len:142 (+),score=14.16 TRINITY_DN3694_c0_g1_i10:76-501(+)
MATPDELHLQLQWNHANEVHRLLDETFDLMDIEQRGLVGIKEGVPWVQAMGTRSADDVKLSKAMWTRRVTAIGCFNEESKMGTEGFSKHAWIDYHRVMVTTVGTPIDLHRLKNQLVAEKEAMIQRRANKGCEWGIEGCVVC